MNVWLNPIFDIAIGVQVLKGDKIWVIILS